MVILKNFGQFLVRNSEQNESPHIKKVQIGRIFFFFLCVCPRCHSSKLGYENKGGYPYLITTAGNVNIIVYGKPFGSAGPIATAPETVF